MEKKFEERRKKGGQPGNRNALKHGYYSRAMTRQELSELEEAGKGLIDEIDLLRTIIRRVAELAVDEKSRRELMRLLDTLGAAGVRLASMLRTQKVYFEGITAEEVQRSLAQALTEFWAEHDGPELG